MNWSLLAHQPSFDGFVGTAFMTSTPNSLGEILSITRDTRELAQFIALRTRSIGSLRHPSLEGWQTTTDVCYAITLFDGLLQS